MWFSTTLSSRNTSSAVSWSSEDSKGDHTPPCFVNIYSSGGCKLQSSILALLAITSGQISMEKWKIDELFFLQGRLLGAHFFSVWMCMQGGMCRGSGGRRAVAWLQEPFLCSLSIKCKQLPAVVLLQTLLLVADSASQWESLTSQKRQLQAGLSSQPSFCVPCRSLRCIVCCKSNELPPPPSTMLVKCPL